MIVSDAGPVIIFARIARLHLLRDIAGALLIPDAVFDEIVVKGAGMPGALEVEKATWIKRATLADRTAFDSLPTFLHERERQAIALAKEPGAQLLLDDIRARRVASGLGVEVIGTLRILAEAKKLGLISLARPLVVQMQFSGYRFDRDLVRNFLHRIGEI